MASVLTYCSRPFLQYLYNLVHLDLSWNKLTDLQGVHTKLGNIKTLNLAGNELEMLSGLSKLYSLVNLDLSSNRLAQVRKEPAILSMCSTDHFHVECIICIAVG